MDHPLLSEAPGEIILYFDTINEMNSISPDSALAKVLVEGDTASKLLFEWLRQNKGPRSTRLPDDEFEPSAREKFEAAARSLERTLKTVTGEVSFYGGPNHSRYSAPILVREQLRKIASMKDDFTTFADHDELKRAKELVDTIFSAVDTAQEMLVAPDYDLVSRDASMEQMKYNYLSLTRGTKFWDLSNHIHSVISSTRPGTLDFTMPQLQDAVSVAKAASEKLHFTEASGLPPHIEEYKVKISAIGHTLVELSAATEQMTKLYDTFASPMYDKVSAVANSLTSIGLLVPEPGRLPVKEEYIPAPPPAPLTAFVNLSLDETVAAPTYEDPLDKYLKMDSEQRFAAAESALVDLSGLATGELGTEIDSFVTETREMLKEAKSQYESYKAFESTTE